MKLRLVLALVAVAAVVCWLAVPALRIWQAPATRDHTHSRFSPLFKISVWRVDPPLVATTFRCRNEAMQITHRASFASRYWTMLLGRRWADPAACGLDGSIVLETVMDNPKPKWGDTIAKGVYSLLLKSRAKSKARPAQ